MSSGGGLATLALLAVLPAVGMIAGAVGGELWRISRSAIGGTLHAAAGVAVAVVSVELMPRILSDIRPWQLVLAFALGAGVSVLMVKGVRRAVRKFAGGGTGAWMVYLAVAVDLLSDGLMVGIGSAVAQGLGLMLALSQVIANVPGGFVAITTLRDKGVKRAIRIGAAATLVFPVLVGAAIGYWLLRGQSPELQNAALALVVGMLLLATVEDLVPEADEPDTRRAVTTAAFTGGFGAFALLALYVG